MSLNILWSRLRRTNGNGRHAEPAPEPPRHRLKRDPWAPLDYEYKPAAERWLYGDYDYKASKDTRSDD
jgi:hypothetical protein